MWSGCERDGLMKERKWDKVCVRKREREGIRVNKNVKMY
jgi:hypothetical protein